VTRTHATILTLCAAVLLPAQPSNVAAQSAAKHFQLTFVISYPQHAQPSQTFVLDVPVADGRTGTAGSSTRSGLTGDPSSIVQENLECSEVRQSPQGLSAKVAFSMNSITKPANASAEPRMRNFTFNRDIDVVFGKSSRITEEPHINPLGNGDDSTTQSLPPAPQITVTAVEI
jgi:hypothetical protein